MTERSGIKDLSIIYVNVFLYAMCYQFQRPIEPYMVERLKLNGSSISEYARLQSFFQVMQTAGSLIFGILIDRFGFKNGFLLSFGASGLSYFLLANATSISLLYLSKIPTIFQSGFLCAQVAATHITLDGTQRIQALGRLTTSYTLGVIVGPAVGGWLGASGDYYAGAKLAVLGSILSIILTFFMEDNGHSRPSPTKLVTTLDKIETSTSANLNPAFSISHILNIIYSVKTLLATKLITGFANSMSSSAFPIILKDTFKLNEFHSGLCMSILSFGNAAFNGLMLGPIIQYFQQNSYQIIFIALLGMFILYTLQSFSNALINSTFISTVTASFQSLALPFYPSFSPSLEFFTFFSACIFQGFCQYLLATTVTSEATSRVADDERGMLLGLEHSLFAASRVISPQSGISLWQYGGIVALTGVCGQVFLFSLFLWMRFGKVDMAEQLAVGKKPERKEK